MPAVAAVSASGPAPRRPACSNTGAKASPVAGPPTSVTEPAITPSSGFSPKPSAMAMPVKFCTKQKSVASTRKTSTWMPPTRSRARLALMPMEVKKATLRVDWRAVSSWTLMPRWRSSITSRVKQSPPTTAAGMLSRSSQRTRFLSWMPPK